MSTEQSQPATSSAAPPRPARQLPFPPVTKQHILNCSYHNWHPKYRHGGITPKARLVPLPDAFLSYLREDGIMLPPDGDDDDNATWSDSDSGIFSGADNDGGGDEAAAYDPSANWRETHEAIGAVIEELGGKVAPKLNWSAPKDATFMAPTNDMECRSPNEIYTLLKSSDFVTHDLEHAFDDTVDKDEGDIPVPYHLVLRKWINLNPSVEFRCFVRDRTLIALCQRDPNHYDFLFKMRDDVRQKIQDFFDAKLRDTFPDPNFTFDVYIEPPKDRVWLIDFNPWAIRTDPLLFSWMELLTLQVPPINEVQEVSQSDSNGQPKDAAEDDVVDVWQPEFRLIRRDDPEAYQFSTPQYSAHKMPKDVVDASLGGAGAMQDFAQQLKEIQRLTEQQTGEDSESD